MVDVDIHIDQIYFDQLYFLFFQVIAISLIYMALKMTKLDACDWNDRQPGEQWWDQFVANLSLDMMEEVSHVQD